MALPWVPAPQARTASAGPNRRRATSGFKSRGRHRAARPLAHAPGRAGIGAADHLHHLREGLEVQLVAAKRARQQQAKQLGLVQRRDDVGGKRARRLDPIRGALQQLHHRLGANNRIRLRFRFPPARALLAHVASTLG